LKQLDIVHEDNFCIVLNKPAGLAVQGGKGVGISLDDLLQGSWPERPLLVHRLDRDTSGLILAAKTKESAVYFSCLFGKSDRTVMKRYIAVCKDKPLKQEGSIVLDLDIKGSIKKSETRYRVIPDLPHGCIYSVIELELGTGRMHQIRRHLALTGNPVLGDDKYGDFNLNHMLRKTMKLHHLLLHASRLVIPAMPDGKCLDVIAPLPVHFTHFLAQL